MHENLSPLLTGWCRSGLELKCINYSKFSFSVKPVVRSQYVRTTILALERERDHPDSLSCLLKRDVYATS